MSTKLITNNDVNERQIEIEMSYVNLIDPTAIGVEHTLHSTLLFYDTLRVCMVVAME